MYTAHTNTHITLSCSTAEGKNVKKSYEVFSIIKKTVGEDGEIC